MEKKEHFGSKFGAMAAIVGSAVGLGNIWRFPYMVGDNGGGAFIILYLVLVLLVGLPIVLAEFSIGRAGKGNVSSSFKALAPGTKWYLVGILGVASAIVIMMFYSVIAGWTAFFLKSAILNEFSGKSESQLAETFSGFINSGWQPIIWSAVAIILTSAIVARGVRKGVEKFNKILMPTLVGILIVLSINSFTLSGIDKGLDFLFTIDFSELTWSTVMAAMGQVFFTLSVGMGVMITYGAYVKQDENMIKSKATVVLIDTSIAIISGIAIFPAVFTYNIPPTSGPDLVFLTLPNIFSQMPGGYFVALLFFVLLLIAALTSLISLFEVIISYAENRFKMSRRKIVAIISIAVFSLSCLAALSQMKDSELKVFGMSIFDLADSILSSYMLILGGLFIVIFAGWRFSSNKMKAIMSADGKYKLGLLYDVVRFFIKFVAPLVIVILLLSKMGVL